MRTRAKALLGVAVILGVVAAAASLSAQVRPRLQRMDTPKLTFTTQPESLSVATPGGAVEEPAPLSRSARLQAARDLSQLAGRASSMGARPDVPPPIEHTVTARNPVSGRSSLAILNGSSVPGENKVVLQSLGHSMVSLWFEPVVPNRAYMLDCTASAQNDRPFRLSGAISGNIHTQSGHLLGGFIASERHAKIGIRKPKGSSFAWVHRCELSELP